MCGIGGLLRIHHPQQGPSPAPDEAIPEHWLDALDTAVAHRGPDGRGRFRDRAERADGAVVDIALVHRRLSVIDHEGGGQPMVLDDAAGRLAVVFNGCVYNHRPLRAELRAAGHAFHTDHSDTEVLLHGWREWGEELPDRLISMHAFAIWDAARADLFLSRDRFGEKPLYIAVDRNAGTLAFASVPGVLAKLFSTALDTAAIAQHITFGYADPATPWQDVRIAPPDSAGLAAGVLLGERPDRRDRRSNDRPPRLLPQTRAKLFRHSPSLARKLLEPVDQLLGEAVGARLEADLPVACLLSGGVDSSLIAHHAKRAAGELTTICVRMPDRRLDESDAAQAVANHLGTDHITVDAISEDPAGDLITLIETLGLPFGDSSLLPTFWACRAAAEHAGVVLTGDGGDELFVGYDRHVAVGHAEWLRLLSVPSWVVPMTIFPTHDPASRASRAQRLLLALRRQSYESLLAIFPAPHAADLLGLRAHKPGANSMPGSAAEAAAFDLWTTLPGDYLRKVDTASMALPIETRAPFLDPSLAQAAHELGSLRTVGGRKGFLRALARRHLPAAIVDRPKRGFAIPIGEWFRSDFGGLRQLLHDHLLAADPFPGLDEAGIPLNLSTVRRMLREHDAAGEPTGNPWHGADHGQRLYMLLVLAIWCRWQQRCARTALCQNPLGA